MGEAKKRGTKEQREADARQRNLREADVRQRNSMEADLSQKNEAAVWFVMGSLREELRSAWSQRANALGESTSNGPLQVKAFCSVLDYIWATDYSGACHSTSAILYMLLSEVGLKPALCIGEVRLGSRHFDHSWVELNGKIFDAAVSLPLKYQGSAFAGGPVFKSIDLSTNIGTHLVYGANSGKGLDPIALEVAQNDLSGYHRMQINDGQDIVHQIWSCTESLARKLGLTVAAHDLEKTYGSVYRTIRRCL